MKVFISYSRKFRENLVWVIEKKEEKERIRKEEERKKRLDEEKRREDERVKIMEQRKKENEFVSRFEFEFKTQKKVVRERPDLRQDIVKQNEDIEKVKNRILGIQTPADEQLQVVKTLVDRLQNKIAEQDLRNRF
jgi:hypothetical protein